MKSPVLQTQSAFSHAKAQLQNLRVGLRKTSGRRKSEKLTIGLRIPPQDFENTFNQQAASAVGSFVQ